MVSRKRKVLIDNEAKTYLRKAYNYIKNDSPQNAEKVKNKILTSIMALQNNPEMHPPDKFRLNNDGSFRAFEIYKYRITYQISPHQINVIRIRHSRMNPLEY